MNVLWVVTTALNCVKTFLVHTSAPAVLGIYSTRMETHVVVSCVMLNSPGLVLFVIPSTYLTFRGHVTNTNYTLTLGSILSFHHHELYLNIKHCSTKPSAWSQSSSNHTLNVVKHVILSTYCYHILRTLREHA